MTAFDLETIVIGAGAVGLAIAAHCAQEGDEVVVLEAGTLIGAGTSSRNSEVIHAGIYYPNGSLKHRACINGRRMLYEFLVKHHVAHAKCGKLIVSTSADEEAMLGRLYNSAITNGVEGVVRLSRAEALLLEPALSCTAALYSPETGIFDSHGYMMALQSVLQEAGGMIAFATPVERVEVLAGGGFRVVTGGAEPTDFTCKRLINSAGLSAQAIARRIKGLNPDKIPPLYLAKGSYFSCTTKLPFKHLIYPAPVAGGLGVHVTFDLHGQGRFGPDAEWLETCDPERIDYAVDPARSASFYEVVRRYWPGLPDGAIVPDYSGCRPKIVAPCEPAGDFRIDGAKVHGVPGLVSLYGIESPGLTASLALAEDAAAKRLEA